MKKHILIGSVFGLVFIVWFFIALTSGEVSVNTSGSHTMTGYKPLSRADEPGKYWAAMSGLGLVVLVYWGGFIWFIRHRRQIEQG